jgi:predicted phage terminase large subunit-like protein
MQDATMAQVGAMFGNKKVMQAVQKELATRKLRSFIKTMWRYLDPAPYIHGWHIDCICEHLEAVLAGDIRRLLITMPPRHMKSIAVSVSFPAWAWLSDPKLQFLFASYAHTLSIRDSTKCRRVIESPLYQEFWKDSFQLTTDQNTKIRFDNDQGGYRIASSVDGAITGEGGDIIVVDDPHNVRQAESTTQRQAVLDWWDEAMSTRLNNPKTGRMIIVQQRVHENDLAGHVMEVGGWTHLNLPARYESDNKCITPIWKDPRVLEGELLWKERFGEEEMVALERALGPYGTASQLQQRPSPREGGLFLADKIGIHEFAVGMVPENGWVRSWDKAGSVLTGAYSVGVKFGKTKDGRFVIGDVVRGQWGSAKRERMIKQTAEMDGSLCPIIIEQEPGSGGKESAENTVRNLAGFFVIVDRPTGNKETRAYPLSSQVNMGNVLLQRAPWNKALLDEFRMFPNGKYKDQVDATSAAFNYQCGKRVAGGW